MPMNLNINYIVDHLFQKQTLEDVDVRDIEQVSEKYPYYTPVQFLLAKKYQQTGTEQYAEQVKKTALYFTNPHWLQALLHPEELPDTDFVVINKTENSSAEANKPANETIMVEQVIEQPITEEIAAGGGELLATENTTVAEQEEAIVTEPTPSINTIEEVVESIQEESELPVEEIKDRNTIAEPVAEVTGSNLDDEDEIDSDLVEDEHLPSDIKLPTGDFSLAAAKAAFTQPLPDNVKAEDAIIPIEPLHTVDYFASQGIKLSNEYPGKDELSKRLKSFTEWLKTMKKIHPEKLEAAMDGTAQSTIQHIAEHSNEQKDTVTEAMAEVYARQGLAKKAIETYQKLSLLNPDKRVYFAAKISKLNEK